jgi:hypothetical protein
MKAPLYRDPSLSFPLGWGFPASPPPFPFARRGRLAIGAGGAQSSANWLLMRELT